MATDDQRLQRIMQEILAGQPDAFVVGYLRPDGVTQLCVGGDLQKRKQQVVAHKLLTAYLLRNVSHEFGEDEAEFVADGLDWLDNEDELLEHCVDAGLLPEEALSRYQDGGEGYTPADMLSDMVADADMSFTDGQQADHGEEAENGAQRYCVGCDMWIGKAHWDDHADHDDEDGEPGGTNIPIQ